MAQAPKTRSLRIGFKRLREEAGFTQAEVATLLTNALLPLEEVLAAVRERTGVEPKHDPRADTYTVTSRNELEGVAPAVPVEQLANGRWKYTFTEAQLRGLVNKTAYRQTYVSRREAFGDERWGGDPTPDEIAVLEDAVAVPRGTIYRWCGYAVDPATPEEVIRGHLNIRRPDRESLLALLEFFEKSRPVVPAESSQVE